MSELAQKECVPCKGGVPSLTSQEILPLKDEIHKDWEVVHLHHLHRKWETPDFKTALDFTNRIGEIAEREGHHPNIMLTWGMVEVDIWTHKIDGLTESDFILAAKIDRLKI